MLCVCAVGPTCCHHLRSCSEQGNIAGYLSCSVTLCLYQAGIRVASALVSEVETPQNLQRACLEFLSGTAAVSHEFIMQPVTGDTCQLAGLRCIRAQPHTTR